MKITYVAILALSASCLADCAHTRSDDASQVPGLRQSGNTIEAVRLAGPPNTRAERALPLVYWSELHTGADTQAIHVVRVDLQNKAIEVDAVIGDDPDGDGPAEASLTDPLQLARRYHVLAAVNANAFAGLPNVKVEQPNAAPGSPAKYEANEHWYERQPVNIEGLAVHDGITRSKGPEKAAPDVAFGVDARGKPYIGPAQSSSALEEAVNAWSFTMFQDGKPKPAPGGVRHPRTAVGFDQSGRWLYIVVVDGRQPNYSNGMTPRELTDLMVRLGAANAANLDGGGSSIMLIGKRDGTLDIINKPSGGSPRPVPVLLSVRSRAR